MDDEAFFVLDAIRRGKFDGLDGREHWLKAFRTISWLVDTQNGPALTDAGVQAHDDMIGKRRANSA